MNGITCEWAMSTIEDNLATLRDTSSVQAWSEFTNHRQDDRSQNVIKVQLA